ncbi:hypothetical protein [Aestuariibaculum suncheonense]|uniref:Secreted protein (Por secretion system target) n=1 Tax=Aestuariibaculum suncheonense TaxID=1028745 RepID=A0A8J6Q3R2_9FLAO|nr:hypothetical protein [Aestuariibaculum suncheonense]MBD0833891.1 hypothetical protein [Aestuariibaculum suncheonense]
MKNTVKILNDTLLVLALSTSLLSNATEVSVSTNNNKITTTAFTINHVKVGDLLSIKDVNGATLYMEAIQKAGTYKKGFDLSALPNGNYFFEVEKALEIKTVPFSVNFEKVTFNKNEETITYKPFVKQENGILFISKLAPNHESLKINIYAEQNSKYELIHSEKIKGIQSIDRVYRLEKGGNYKLVFISNDKEYTKFINN